MAIGNVNKPSSVSDSAKWWPPGARRTSRVEEVLLLVGATSCRPLSFVGLRRVGEFHFTSFACQFWGSVNLIVISLRMGMGFPFNSSGV